jgi:hypothetical protein
MHENTNNYDSDYSARVRRDKLLIERLDNNYKHLHSLYRLGNSEGFVGYLRKLKVDQNPESFEFFEFCDVSQRTIAGSISFAAAIDDLYRLVEYIEKERKDLAHANGVLLLRCKCVIYEATDYFLKVPEELGEYFVNLARRLSESEQEIEASAEKLNGGVFRDKDQRAKVIKLQLIAAIWGANQLFREHNPYSYDRALVILQKVNRIISETLPGQHEQPRDCFGILGLSQYLTGRVLFRKNLVEESQHAFRKSADAYHARLRQKEEFCAKELISPQLFEEKVSVTIRRTALVTAFGDGYQHFVSGQLTRALESLTLARAALTRNSGKIYLIYVDMLYWACRRARESSNPETLELCVEALRDCRGRFGEFIPESHYFHRAGIQLALASLCRMRLTGDVTGADYDEGCKYINDAIEYAECKTAKRDFRNPSLLAAALVAKSRFLRARCAADSVTADHKQHLDYLNEAMKVAAEAHLVSEDIKLVQTEASAVLGEVHTDLAALNLTWNEIDFPRNFDAALKFFERAIAENNRQNLRNHAVCLLGLTRLCLLNPNTEMAAREHFAEWKMIEKLVEHSNCQTMAKQLEPKFSSPVLLIKISEPLHVQDWQDVLLGKLIDEALERFWTKDRLTYSQNKWRKLLLHHLQTELKYGSTTVSKLITKLRLLDRVIAMRNKPIKPRPTKIKTKRKKPSS